MTKNRQLLASGAAIAAIAALGIVLAMSEKSPRHHHLEGLPEDSASSPMRGTDWNGPIAMPTTSATAEGPTAAPSDPAMPGSGVVPPPLDAIPQPTIAPPLDDTMAAGQRARAIQMLQNRVISLQREAADDDAKGDTTDATATRVRIERMKGRIAQLQDGGAP